MKASVISRSASVSSQYGTRMRTLAVCFLKLPSQERYLGLVHGSTAPSSRESEGSGMTRFMSKSIVLPKPWQRGQAPNGELKLNRIGSGWLNSRLQVLHWKRSLKRRRSPPAADSKMTSPDSRKQISVLSITR